MFERLASRRSTRSQRPHEPPNDRPQASIPQITPSAATNDGTIHRNGDGSAGSHPDTPVTTVPSFSGTSHDGANQQTSRQGRILWPFWRKPSSNPNCLDQSSTSHAKHPTPMAPVQISPNDPRPPLSPLPTEVNVDSPRAMRGARAARGTNTSIRTQQEPADIESVPATLAAPVESVPRGSAGDRKETIISGIKLILESAAIALKPAPIANLDQIPNTLLTWIRIYENVSGNTDDLDQLCVVIQQAQDSVLEPLRKWTGEIPPELENLVQETCVALKKQVEGIESIQKKNLFKRIIQASDITQQISNMKNCLNDAIHRFQLRISTLTLLRTERLSVHSELSRLRRAPAEHTCVKSKSECLPGTRVEMQESLLKHLREAKNRFVWLRGSPGTGKTAISMSVASTLEEMGILAASFFWDKNRTGTGLDSIEQFPSTLAHHLASFNEDFKFSLVRHLRKQALASVQDFPLEKQIKALTIEPMRDVKNVLSPDKDRFVIVLDGLDECGDQETLESLMKLVLSLQELPPAFAVLVSCRPESAVISAWSKARTKGHVIPCEDVDKIIKDEAFYTVRRMVEEGLQDLIHESSWEPTRWELDDFAHACRGLPVMASIRIRDVRLQTRRGRTLQSVFQELLNITNAPANLNGEYLRILRQAYMLDSSGIHLDVAKKYRLVVGAIVTVHSPLSLSFMSQLFRIVEDELRATLEPISSIIDLASESTRGVSFYHATAKEFVTGDPIGDEKDKVFFINDAKGYFLGLPILRLFNDCCERNVFGIPTDPPLGDKTKWKEFMEKKDGHYIRFYYIIRYLLEHLDPSQLFLQESTELKNEFNTFIKRNLLTFTHLRGTNWGIPEEFLQFNNHDSIQLLGTVKEAFGSNSPWEFYRSILPFNQSILQHYGHLSDVRVFSILDKFSGGTIPLSEDLLRAQMTMRAKLSELSTVVENWETVRTDYEIEFYEPDVRNGIVTCAALSPDGRYVALGFGSGVIEVADINDQRTICRLQRDPDKPPAWIEFVYDSRQVVAEGEDWSALMGPRTFPTNSYPPQHDPYDRRYPSKRFIFNSKGSNIQLPAHPYLTLIPLSRAFAPSPGAQSIGTFNDGIRVVTWSTRSCKFIGAYHVEKSHSWIIGPNVPPTRSYHTLKPAFNPSTSDTSRAHHPETDAGHEPKDGFWIKCAFYDPPSRPAKWPPSVFPSTEKTVPLIDSSSVWLNGREILTLPGAYRPTESREPWYGDRLPADDRKSYPKSSRIEPHLDEFYYLQSQSPKFYRPQSSRDGTRFLIQGKSRAPIVVDTSRIV